MLSFSSFDSFPDRRQVVYTVETLEFQKFSRNSEINSNFEILLATINMFAVLVAFEIAKVLFSRRFRKKQQSKVAINIVSVSKTVEIHKIKGKDVVWLFKIQQKRY